MSRAPATATRPVETAPPAAAPPGNNVVAAPGSVLALSDEDIALMAGDTGKQTFNKNELMTPQFQLIQSTSGYVKRDTPNYLADAREGDFIDNMTRTLRQDARLIIARYEMTYTEWKPDMGGIVKQWGTDASGYEAATGDYGPHKTSTGNEIVAAATYYALLLTDDEGSSMPVVVYLTSTDHKEARRLNSLLASLEFKGGPNGTFTAPTWARLYNVKAVRKTNDQGSWYGWQFDPGVLTLASPGGKQLYNKAKLFAESIGRGEVQAAPMQRGSGVAADGQIGSQESGSGSADPNADIPF